MRSESLKQPDASIRLPADARCAMCSAGVGGLAVSDVCHVCQQPLQKTWNHRYAAASNVKPTTTEERRLIGAAIMFTPAALFIVFVY